jgi:hypothetical protein
MKAINRFQVILQLSEVYFDIIGIASRPKPLHLLPLCSKFSRPSLHPTLLNLRDPVFRFKSRVLPCLLPVPGHLVQLLARRSPLCSILAVVQPAHSAQQHLHLSLPLLIVIYLPLNSVNSWNLAECPSGIVSRSFFNFNPS